MPPVSTETQATSAAPGTDPRPPYGWAALAGLAVFALYAVTLAPTTAFWDTSEYIATGHILGIPHPPGNPLFVVLARAWDILLAPLGLSVAVRINLFSAFMSAAAHALWFLVIHHVLRFFGDRPAFRLGGAAAAVLVSATAFTVWNQSNVNEKVYTVSLLTIALLSWLVVRWQERLGRGKDDNLLVLMAFILALSVGNHLMAFLAAPAMLVFILLVRPATLANWKLYPPILVAVLLGLSIHLFLPLRADLDPVINEAAPECESLGGALTSIATYGNAGCDPLNAALKREQYSKPSMLANPWNPDEPRDLSLMVSQYLNYLQYFDWQWARSLAGTDTLFPPLRVLFTMLFTGLGVWGALEHRRRDTPSFWYMLVLFGTLSVGLTFYLNFKYGYSMPSPQSDFRQHEVRERDYFFIVSFSVWGLWAGMGIAALWQTARERVGSLAKGAPVLLLAALPLVLNWPWATRSYDYAARDWAYNLLMSVEPYGVLFTNGDNDTFPLWYLQEVEGIRRDVTVIVTSYLNTAWYAKQLRDLTEPCSGGEAWSDDPTRILCQREYLANTPDVYTSPGATATPEAEGVPGDPTPIPVVGGVRPPARSIMELDDETLEQIAGSYLQLDRNRAFGFGDIRVVLPEGMVLYPWHQYALSILNTAIGDRPIYFASSGNAAQELGLEPYLIRQGLAFRVSERPLAPDSLPPGVVRMPEGAPLNSVTGRVIDVRRSALLADSVFVHRSDLPRWSHWPDPSTVGIPNYYAWVLYGLYQAAFLQGDEEAADAYLRRAEEWTQLGSRVE
jgi:hypothetical protein